MRFLPKIYGIIYWDFIIFKSIIKNSRAVSKKIRSSWYKSDYWPIETMFVYQCFWIAAASVLLSTVNAQNVSANESSPFINAPMKAVWYVFVGNFILVSVCVALLVLISKIGCGKSNIRECSGILGPFDSLCRDQILLISIVIWNINTIGKGICIFGFYNLSHRLSLYISF